MGDRELHFVGSYKRYEEGGLGVYRMISKGFVYTTLFDLFQFKIQNWPENEYGNFYSGDSYIVLNTYQREGE